jgi:hypothetical protein
MSTVGTVMSLKSVGGCLLVDERRSQDYTSKLGTNGPRMKAGTMSTIGLLMIAAGIMSSIIGTLIVYSALGDYSQCLLAPLTCPLNAQAYVRFLNNQQYGSSASFYGLIVMVIGAILYTSAQVRKMGVVVKDTGSRDTQN